MHDPHIESLLSFVKVATGRNVRLRYSSILKEFMIEVLWSDEKRRQGNEVQISIQVSDLDHALGLWEKANGL